MRAVELVRAVVDKTVVDSDTRRRRPFVPAPAAADVHAAPAQIVDVTTLDTHIGAPFSQPDAVRARVRDLAIDEVRLAETDGLDQARLINLALARVPEPPELRVAVLKR